MKRNVAKQIFSYFSVAQGNSKYIIKFYLFFLVSRNNWNLARYDLFRKVSCFAKLKKYETVHPNVNSQRHIRKNFSVSIRDQIGYFIRKKLLGKDFATLSL